MSRSEKERREDHRRLIDDRKIIIAQLKRARREALSAAQPYVEEVRRIEAALRAYGLSKRSSGPPLRDVVYQLLPEDGSDIGLDKIVAGVKEKGLEYRRDNIIATLSVLVTQKRTVRKPGVGIYARVKGAKGVG